MQISRTRQPTTFWWPTRMWRAVDTGLYTFMHPTKALFNLQVLVTQGLATSLRRRRLVGGPGFEKMRVDSWHIQTLPDQVPSTFGQVCHYSHQNLVGEWPTWKLTLIPLYIQQEASKYVGEDITYRPGIRSRHFACVNKNGFWVLARYLLLGWFV